jgi:hypothetical protein
MNKILPRNFSYRTMSVVALAVLTLGSQAPAASAQTDPKKIMDGVYQQDTSHDSTLKAVFEIYDQAGKKRQKKVTVQRIGAPGNSKILVRFTDPPEVKGVALLSINRRGEKDRQWLYIPATKRARPVAPRDRSEKFAATDFTYEDLADRTTDDYTYQLLNDSEVVDGHKTYKIAATPRDQASSQYKFVYYWVAQDVPVILNAELYDLTGKKIRILHATNIKKANNIYGTRHVEMTTVADGTRTVLTIDSAAFNKALNESLFTPESLEAAQ